LKIPPNTAFVLFSSGAFGGAERRFTNLFLHLNSLHPGKFCFIINQKLLTQLKRAFNDLPENNILLVGGNAEVSETIQPERSISAEVPPDPLELDRKTSLPRKIYWYFKNMYRQKKLFGEIEKIRQKKNIEVFIGVFSGVLPLAFYLGKRNNYPAVIFSNMDSWFSEVHSDMKKLWYRKYYSFNYAMENADMVDFLSPYLLEGVKKRNVSIPENRISIAPSSFADYSNCKTGKKERFEIAFSSRLEEGKNPFLYLEAAEEVLKSHPEVKFYLLGEGTLEGALRDHIERRGLCENIDFRFHPDPPEIFADTSVFVSLQSGTNYPSQSVLEAMACGNAIIASNTGDTGMFINNTNGLLVELSKDSVTAAMMKLIENPMLTKKLGEGANKTARESHTLENMTGYYLNLISKVSSAKNG
jgi:glycosyltransferase involved in cell wall biosynthesis